MYCMFCNLSLSNDLESLLHHSRICAHVARPTADYTHMCIACSYHTSKSQNMRNHLRRHTGEKPFKCEYCPYRCSQISNLKKHVQIRHSNVKHCLNHAGYNSTLS
uniref:Zinc finger protein 64 homolog, isoforms 1 and 2 n=1 Tax=Cacopsylla melanoneura TaxID=428564 RepID=A0A8D8YIE8_9HEMI